jgi:hypothetical protein
MPNWCSNQISFWGNSNELDTFKSDVKKIKMGDCLFTTLTDVKIEWDYYLWIEEFGTKWSVSMDEEIYDSLLDNYTINCQTAWSPCIEFVQKVCKKYTLSACIEFSESGMNFAGIYDINENGEIVKKVDMECEVDDYEEEEENCY